MNSPIAGACKSGAWYGASGAAAIGAASGAWMPPYPPYPYPTPRTPRLSCFFSPSSMAAADAAATKNNTISYHEKIERKF